MRPSNAALIVAVLTFGACAEPRPAGPAAAPTADRREMSNAGSAAGPVRPDSIGAAPSSTPGAPAPQPSLARSQNSDATFKTPVAQARTCKSYKQLPATKFERPTLVDDDCIEIPDKARIRVSKGVIFAIIATKDLRLGRDVGIDATGERGDEPGPAPEADHVIWNADVTKACREGCGCPGGADHPERLWAPRGNPGHSAGKLLIVAREMSAWPPAGWRFDVTGGPGGNPHESGRTHCASDVLDCWSPRCTGPDSTAGAAGRDGTVSFSLGSSDAPNRLVALVSRVFPAGGGSGSAAATPEAFKADAEAIEKLANLEHWDRLSGK
jgi:hypothetical protein